MNIQQRCFDFEAGVRPGIDHSGFPWQVRALAAQHNLSITRAALIADLAGFLVGQVQHGR